MIFDGNAYREETQGEKDQWEAEQEKWEREHPAPPTEAERLEALENQLAGIVSAYREGVNEA